MSIQLDSYVVVDFEGNLASNTVFRYFDEASDFIDEVCYCNDTEYTIMTVNEYNLQAYDEV